MGFDHDARTSVSCSDQFDPHCSRESQRRPVTYCHLLCLRHVEETLVLVSGPGAGSSLSPVMLLANTLKGQQRLGTGPAGYPVLAHLDLVFRTYAPHDSPFWRIPLRKDLISQGTSHLGTPDHGMWQT